jgi:ankyrin
MRKTEIFRDLRKGVPVWLFGRDGALFRAAAVGDLTLCKELVGRGADVNTASAQGFTPLHRAAQNGHTAVVEYLLSKGATPTSTQSGETPLDMAQAAGHEKIAALLKPQG